MKDIALCKCLEGEMNGTLEKNVLIAIIFGNMLNIFVQYIFFSFQLFIGWPIITIEYFT